MTHLSQDILINFIQAEKSLIKIIGTRIVSDFRFISTSKYLHIHNELTWAWDSSLDTELLLFLINLMQQSSGNFIQLKKTTQHEVKLYSVEFSTG